MILNPDDEWYELLKSISSLSSSDIGSSCYFKPTAKDFLLASNSMVSTVGTTILTLARS